MGRRQKATFMRTMFNRDTRTVRRVWARQESSRIFMQDDLFKFPRLTVIPALIHKRHGMEGCHEDHDLTRILINDACSERRISKMLIITPSFPIIRPDTQRFPIHLNRFSDLLALRPGRSPVF